MLRRLTRSRWMDFSLAALLSMVTLFTLMIMALLALLAVSMRRARKAELLRTALALDLSVEEGGWLSSGPRLSGTFEGVRVVREPYVVSTGKSSQRFTRFIAHGVPPAVTVKRQGLGQQLLKVFGGEDQAVGDPGFDERFVVKGDPLWVSAALPDAARSALSLATTGNTSLWVEDGRVVCQVPGDVTELESVRARLSAVTMVARAMTVEPGGLVDRLVSVARADDAPGARARALLLLAHVDARRAEPALRAALRDPEPAVRVGAAVALREPEAARQVLADRTLEVGFRVTLLGLLPEPASARELAGYLTHDEAGVRSAAVTALSAVGGRDEVAPLLALVEREGWGEAARQAEAAVAAIQARLGPVDAGRVSLADDGAGLAGAVSEAGPVGAVSLAAQVRKVIPERGGG